MLFFLSCRVLRSCFNLNTAGLETKAASHLLQAPFSAGRPVQSFDPPGNYSFLLPRSMPLGTPVQESGRGFYLHQIDFCFGQRECHFPGHGIGEPALLILAGKVSLLMDYEKLAIQSL